MKKSCILLILWLFTINIMNAYGQTTMFDKDSLMNRFVSQLGLFPQEKVYLHIDKGTYIPSDTLWFRAYVVDATLHRPVSNKYIYVELVNPLDSIVSQAMIRFEDEMYQGYLPLSRELVDGNYTLRAYTRYMLNNVPECIFRRPVRIVTGSWNKINMKSISLGADNKPLALSFTSGDKPIQLHQADVLVKDRRYVPLELSTQKDGFTIRWGEDDWNRNTSWLLSMRDLGGNKYSCFLPVSTRNEDYKVTFYPEGGYLLNGQSCRVAYKVLGHTGSAVNASIDIVDELGQVILSTRTFHEGMGTFIFTPEMNKKYVAKCMDDFGHSKEFELPDINAKAFHGLRVDVQRDNFKVSLLSVLDASSEPLYLLAHVRGIVLFSEEWKEPQKRYLLPKEYFPAGVVQFLLLNKEGRILSERLAFSDTYGSTKCNVTVGGLLTKKRERISVETNLLDSNQQPLKGIYSVSVVDSKFSSVDSCYNILSHLLLTSELKGNIYSPGFYFKKGNPAARNSLDLLLLTQGWRRYDLPEIMKGKYTTPVLEKHSEMAIRGRTLASSALLSKSDNEHLVSLIGTGKIRNFNRVIPTDKNGYFCFDSIEYADGNGFYIEAIQLKAKKTEKIELFDRKYLKGGDLYPQYPLENDMFQRVQVEDMEIMTRLDNFHFLLQDVIVRAPIWGSRNYRSFTDKDVVRYKDMRSLLKSQGLTISTMTENTEVIYDRTLSADEEDRDKITAVDRDMFSALEGSTSLVEDMIYYNDQRILLFVDDNYCKPDILVNWITPGDIEHMSLVRDVDRDKANDLLQGTLKWSEMYYMNKNYDLCYAYCHIPRSRSKIAILNVTTKNGFDSRCLGWWSEYYMNIQQDNKRKTTFYPLGYQLPVEFYSPEYDTAAKKDNEIPDLRTTLYWNPTLVIDERGSATFSFYTSDQPGSYYIIIEGISDKGDLVHVVKPLIY